MLVTLHAVAIAGLASLVTAAAIGFLFPDVMTALARRLETRYRRSAFLLFVVSLQLPFGLGVEAYARGTSPLPWLILGIGVSGAWLWALVISSRDKGTPSPIEETADLGERGTRFREYLLPPALLVMALASWLLFGPEPGWQVLLVGGALFEFLRIRWERRGLSPNRLAARVGLSAVGLGVATLLASFMEFLWLARHPAPLVSLGLGALFAVGGAWRWHSARVSNARAKT